MFIELYSAVALCAERSLLFEGMTKARNNELSKRLNDMIAQLLGFAEEVPVDSQEYERIRKRLEELERQRRNYRIIRKVRCALIQAILHMLWFERVRGASRALARLTFDSMSVTMPVPPTSRIAYGSLGCGRNMNVRAC